MRCRDCTGIGTQVAAVGVCTQCRAAVRTVHAVHAEVFEQHLTCMKSISRPGATEPPARRLLCGTRATAHRSHAACRPQTADVVRTP